MVTFLWFMFLSTAFLRLLWWLFFRLSIPSEPGEVPAPGTAGISIVVCSHNNLPGLKRLIPLLVTQEYPVFELLIVDDRSDDGSSEWLQEQERYLDLLKTIRIAQTPAGWNPKKYALTQGIASARYSLLALTDSDCLPASPYWLRFVAAALQQPGKSIFLGFSPYSTYPGLLNRLVQTETLFTALQYFSMANRGMTYMGVGRNLGYERAFVHPALQHFPHREHIGGDDDLLINALSTGKESASSTHPESFIYSEPPRSWRQWLQQKRRHLSAGQHYKGVFRWILGSYWISAVGFWLAFAGLCISLCNLLPVAVLFCTFMVGALILYPLFRIFKAERLIPLFLFWDFLYIALLSSIGLSTFGVKNKKWS